MTNIYYILFNNLILISSFSTYSLPIFLVASFYFVRLHNGYILSINPRLHSCGGPSSTIKHNMINVILFAKVFIVIFWLDEVYPLLDSSERRYHCSSMFFKTQHCFYMALRLKGKLSWI